MFGLTQLQERLAWISVIILAFLGYTWYERHQGAEACLSNVASSNAKEEKKEETQHGVDITETKKEGQTFEAAKTQPLTAPVITLGVCPSLHYKAEPSSPATGLSSNGEASVRADNSELPTTVQWDTEPIVRAGHDADAQISGLQKYILTVCRPQ